MLTWEKTRADHYVCESYELDRANCCSGPFWLVYRGTFPNLEHIGTSRTVREAQDLAVFDLGTIVGAAVIAWGDELQKREKRRPREEDDARYERVMAEAALRRDERNLGRHR
jgi:hypothetical protein